MEETPTTKELSSPERTIAHNLLFLLKKKNLTLTNLANQSNLPKGTISNIISKRVLAPTVPVMQKIANVFEMTIDQIIQKPLSDYDYYLHVNNLNNGSFSKIPILSWYNIEQMLIDLTIVDKNNAFNGWLNFNTLPKKGWLFALRSKSSYEPKIPANSFLIFDHNSNPVDNSYVLAQYKNKQECSLIQYFCDGNNEYFTSLYEDKKIIIEPEQIKFLGVLFVIKFDPN